MTYAEFWEEFKKDYDIWNMGLEEYQALRNMAYQIWEKHIKEV